MATVKIRPNGKQRFVICIVASKSSFLCVCVCVCVSILTIFFTTHHVCMFPHSIFVFFFSSPCTDLLLLSFTCISAHFCPSHCSQNAQLYTRTDFRLLNRYFLRKLCLLENNLLISEYLKILCCISATRQNFA
jgi:hypothetical protein